MKTSRYEQLYKEKIRPQLHKELNVANIMATPRIEKIVLNAGVKEAVADSKVLQTVATMLGKITGQLPVRTHARVSIASFKIREGMPLGIRVTLRGKRMYDFLDKLINLALPGVRDFQGVPTKFDGRGNYNLGIREWNIFPEAATNDLEKVYGFNITIHTSATTDAHGYALLKQFNMPFKKHDARQVNG